MIGGSGRFKARGFSLVEMMVVLAISLALFASAMALINSKQRTTAFNQAIQAAQAEIDQVYNDVGNGFYANDGSIGCSNSGGLLVLNSSGTGQGTNKGCSFIGNVMQFGIAGSNRTQVNTYTLVALDSTQPGPINLPASEARVIAKGAGEAATAIPDVFDQVALQYGMTVERMYYTNPGNPIGAIGFVSNLTALGATDGSQRIDVVAIRGTVLDASKENGVDAINASLASGNYSINPVGGVHICFAAAGYDQSGLVTLGGTGRHETSELKIFNGRTCS